MDELAGASRDSDFCRGGFFLLANVIVPDLDRYWLGGFQDPVQSPPDENWGWVSAEEWSFTNWWDGEPNDHWGPYSEWCLEWRPPRWYDVRPSDSDWYIVEFEADATPVQPARWGAIKAMFSR